MNGMSVNRKTPDSFFSTTTFNRWLKDPPETWRDKASFGLRSFEPSLSCVTAVSLLSGGANMDLMEKWLIVLSPVPPPSACICHASMVRKTAIPIVWKSLSI